MSHTAVLGLFSLLSAQAPLSLAKIPRFVSKKKKKGGNQERAKRMFIACQALMLGSCILFLTVDCKPFPVRKC